MKSLSLYITLAIISVSLQTDIMNASSLKKYVPQNQWTSFVASGEKQSSKKNVVPQENIPYQNAVQGMMAKDNAVAVAYLKNSTSLNFNKPVQDDGSTIVHAAVDAYAVNVLTFLLTGEIIEPVEPEKKSVMITLQKNVQSFFQPVSSFMDDVEKKASQLFGEQDNSKIDDCAVKVASFSPVDTAQQAGKSISKYFGSLQNNITVYFNPQDGININMQNENGLTPLHFAMIANKKSLLQLLLDADADLNIQDCDGNTPLMLGIKVSKGTIIKQLIEATNVRDPETKRVTSKLNFDTKDKNGWTALHTAYFLKRDKIAKLLIKSGSRTNIKNPDDLYPAMLHPDYKKVALK